MHKLRQHAEAHLLLRKLRGELYRRPPVPRTTETSMQKVRQGQSGKPYLHPSRAAMRNMWQTYRRNRVLPRPHWPHCRATALYGLWKPNNAMHLYMSILRRIWPPHLPPPIISIVQKMRHGLPSRHRPRLPQMPHMRQNNKKRSHMPLYEASESYS